MVLQQFKMTVTGKCSHTHRNVTILLLAGICQFDRLLRYTVTFNKMEHAGLQRTNGSASCRGTVSKRAVNIIVSKAALIATLTLLGLKQGQQFTTPPPPSQQKWCTSAAHRDICVLHQCDTHTDGHTKEPFNSPVEVCLRDFN